MLLCRWFKETGFEVDRSANEPQLTVRMKRTCPRWAEQVKICTVESWGKVSFPVECHFETFAKKKTSIMPLDDMYPNGFPKVSRAGNWTFIKSYDVVDDSWPRHWDDRFRVGDTRVAAKNMLKLARAKSCFRYEYSSVTIAIFLCTMERFVTALGVPQRRSVCEFFF